jgi:putative transposase
MSVAPEAQPVHLGRVMQAFKSLTTRHYSHGVREYRWPEFDYRLWQRSYHDRIIRSEMELATLRAYIQANPSRRWERQFNAHADGTPP